MKKLLLLLILPALAFAVSSCGGSDSGTDDQPAPHISGITTDYDGKAVAGMPVQINGSNFSPKASDNKVLYGVGLQSTSLEVTEASESRLVWNSDAHRYEIDFDDIERRCADPAAKAFLLCNPHNPCGRLWSREELVRLGEICLRHGIKVISDEIHCEIVAPGRSYVPFASISEEFAQNSVSFVSPTKGFNIAGVQIANMISANADLRARMDRVINVWEHCDVNQFGIVALQAAYSDEGAEWLGQMNAVVHRNFLTLRDLFDSRFPSVRVPELEATYLLWLDFESAMVSSPDAISAHGCSGRGPSQMGGAVRPA